MFIYIVRLDGIITPFTAARFARCYATALLASFFIPCLVDGSLFSAVLLSVSGDL